MFTPNIQTMPAQTSKILFTTLLASLTLSSILLPSTAHAQSDFDAPMLTVGELSTPIAPAAPATQSQTTPPPTSAPTSAAITPQFNQPNKPTCGQMILMGAAQTSLPKVEQGITQGKWDNIGNSILLGVLKGAISGCF
ncbi:hypothetical protein IQ266_27730 [filamentous cyanobacterium LEGE 11480]|uniref:Uncharacterized protein n=1 Tax=Romeriopsis navalis LEGE 11480 TaxID=2777977 RepID=A0A928VTQ4_9CYAN|nr:hypothetical protein [Romeriopsis navalis]MBE9033522.1 hypothetical protein [Romeriopsis navalis LEGE 11480]